MRPARSARKDKRSGNGGNREQPGNKAPVAKPHGPPRSFTTPPAKGGEAVPRKGQVQPPFHLRDSTSRYERGLHAFDRLIVPWNPLGCTELVLATASLASQREIMHSSCAHIDSCTR